MKALLSCAQEALVAGGVSLLKTLKDTQEKFYKNASGRHDKYAEKVSFPLNKSVQNQDTDAETLPGHREQIYYKIAKKKKVFIERPAVSGGKPEPHGEKKEGAKS